MCLTHCRKGSIRSVVENRLAKYVLYKSSQQMRRFWTLATRLNEFVHHKPGDFLDVLRIGDYSLDQIVQLKLWMKLSAIDRLFGKSVCLVLFLS